MRRASTPTTRTPQSNGLTELSRDGERRRSRLFASAHQESLWWLPARNANARAHLRNSGSPRSMLRPRSVRCNGAGGSTKLRQQTIVLRTSTWATIGARRARRTALPSCTRVALNFGLFPPATDYSDAPRQSSLTAQPLQRLGRFGLARTRGRCSSGTPAGLVAGASPRRDPARTTSKRRNDRDRCWRGVSRCPFC